jgi:hypothetical protein
MATAKKATAKKSSNKKDAAEVDDLLGSKKTSAKKSASKGKASKGDDVLEGKKGGSKKAAKKSSGGKAKSGGSGVSTDDIRKAILGVRKLTSYADIASSLKSDDMRQVRRTARGMRDAGEIEIVKEGTVAYVKKA